MEAADDTAPSVAPLGGLVVGREDDVTGAASRAEQRGFGQGEQVAVAEGGQYWRRVRAQALDQARGIFRCNCFNLMDIQLLLRREPVVSNQPVAGADVWFTCRPAPGVGGE